MSSNVRRSDRNKHAKSSTTFRPKRPTKTPYQRVHLPPSYHRLCLPALLTVTLHDVDPTARAPADILIAALGLVLFAGLRCVAADYSAPASTHTGLGPTNQHYSWWPRCLRKITRGLFVLFSTPTARWRFAVGGLLSTNQSMLDDDNVVVFADVPVLRHCRSTSCRVCLLHANQAQTYTKPATYM